MMPPGHPGGGAGLGPGGALDEAIVAASREKQERPPRDWGVQEVGKRDVLTFCMVVPLDRC